MSQSIQGISHSLSAALSKVSRAALLGLTSVCLAGISTAQATVIQISPALDNTLYERPTGDVSNGAGAGLFIGQTGVNAGNVLRRALMSFDLNGQIPAGSVINSVSLDISVNTVPPGATGFDATLHRVSTSWGEGTSSAAGTGGSGAPATTGDATWLHRFFDTDLWSTAGGDFDPTASGTAPIGAGVGTYTFASSPGMVADVQAWVDNPASNFGWIVLGEEANPQNARRFGSRESGAGNAPVLTIDFTAGTTEPPLTPVAVPAYSGWGLLVLMLGMLGLGLITLPRRQRD